MAKQKVNISIDVAILEQLDEYAKSNHMNRSAVIESSVRNLLMQAKATSALELISKAMMKIVEMNGEVTPEVAEELTFVRKLTEHLPTI